MEKKIYEKPELISVIDLDDEICDITVETQVDPGNGDPFHIVNEDDSDFSWGEGDDAWNFAKKSTLWDDEEE